MNLLPQPCKLEIREGFLRSKKLNIINKCSDYRIEKALTYFDFDASGVQMIVKYDDLNSERYTLDIDENAIAINGDSLAGVFYGIQTLKQIFNMDNVPCMHIDDKPDMEYRGVYHDVTRGKIPTVKTMKKFIDTLAYYKINSLQIYVEHTFPFKELGDRIKTTGYLTPEEIKELDDYCYENFIELIPSIPTFGHLYELLHKDEFKELRSIAGEEEDRIFWWQRMRHHTIDPTNEKSIEIIKSLINQYSPLFRTNKFNICCDETFDLEGGKHKSENVGKLYVDFVKQIISYLESKEKKVMMWGDILLRHPEFISELPKDIEFLNWCYSADPDEDSVRIFAETGERQIVCPGTGSWSRLVERPSVADDNISKMLDYGYKYNAVGMLNTNWGDYGNPCSIELAMHGIVLGAAKAWNINTMPDDDFNNSINVLEYKNSEAVKYLFMLDSAQEKVNWNMLAHCYSNLTHEDKFNIVYPEKHQIEAAVLLCKTVISELTEQKWEKDEYREEMLLAAEGIIVIAELFAKCAGYNIERIADTSLWLKKYRQRWLKSNKESELCEIEKMFISLEEA